MVWELRIFVRESGRLDQMGIYDDFHISKCCKGTA
jgi:hypothetical protein